MLRVQQLTQPSDPSLTLLIVMKPGAFLPGVVVPNAIQHHLNTDPVTRLPKHSNFPARAPGQDKSVLCSWSSPV
eukprot:1158798-Pelagomonas_calceolata.AAC.4